jgi:CMP-N,N'-diacetyllegionaminic acid synthase
MTGAIAIILARRGSKGVPGKNAALVAGRPCIAWTIAAVKAATRIGRVVVSTDDGDIAAVAREHDIEVIQRPPALASDTARVDDAARHAIQQLEIDSRDPACLLLYANVPVRPEGLLDRALALLAESQADSVQSYSPVGKFHPWWMTRVDVESGQIRPWEGDILNHNIFRRQDLPPAFVPDGGVIALTRAALMLEIPGVLPGPHAFLGRDRRGIINPEGSVVDIDTPTDLWVADAVLRQKPERDTVPGERGSSTIVP